MTDSTVLHELTELVRLHRYSLLRYIADADPYGDPGVLESLRQMGDMQDATAGRLESLILDRDGPLPTGDYPAEFAAYHDLSLDYLLPLVTAHQRALVQRIEDALPHLTRDAEARAVVEEALGEAIGHLETLEEWQGKRQPAAKAT